MVDDEDGQHGRSPAARDLWVSQAIGLRPSSAPASTCSPPAAASNSPPDVKTGSRSANAAVIGGDIRPLTSAAATRAPSFGTSSNCGTPRNSPSGSPPDQTHACGPAPTRSTVTNWERAPGLCLVNTLSAVPGAMVPSTFGRCLDLTPGSGARRPVIDERTAGGASTCTGGGERLHGRTADRLEEEAKNAPRTVVQDASNRRARVGQVRRELAALGAGTTLTRGAGRRPGRETQSSTSGADPTGAPAAGVDQPVLRLPADDLAQPVLGAVGGALVQRPPSPGSSTIREPSSFR